MRRASLLLAAIALLSSCPRTGPGLETPSGQLALSAEETERRQRVRAELERYDSYAIAFDASALSEPDRELLRALVRAAELVEELNMLQVHPRNLEWLAEVRERGTDDDRELFRRYQMPWCHDDDSPLCAAMLGLPERRVGAALWPEGMTAEELDAMSRAPNARELLSPFTAVERRPEGSFAAVAYGRTELLGPRMAEVAEALRQAAEHADEPTLERFLRSRADAFVSDDPFPWDRSDYDWIALDGRWEVTIGPYEVYNDPHEIKARFEMYVGLIDPEVTEATLPFREELQEMENALADLVGREVYAPRQLSGDGIAIRAVRVVLAAGDARNPAGATVAYHLPNRGDAVDDGLYKKVILVTHMAAFEPIVRARAALVLDEDQAALVSGAAATLDTTFHEFAHGIGAYDELAIEVAGARTTVGEALGEYATLLEEEKADVVGLWLMGRLREAGRLSEDEAARWYLSHVMHLFGLLQYSIEGVYPRMVAIQLGHFMDRGAVSYDAGTGRFRVHLERMPEATEELAREVARIQLTGDRSAAAALHDRYVGRGEGGYALVPSLAGPVTAMRERFQGAGIRSVNMRYDVTGL